MLLRLPVHLEVHLFVEEGQEPLYLGGFSYGVLITPDEILDPPAPGLHRPVRCDPLVRTPRRLLALDEHAFAYVLGRDIVARRQPRLEQYLWPLRLRYYLPVHPDLDVPVAIQHVDTVVGVARVDEDLLKIGR